MGNLHRHSLQMGFPEGLRSGPVGFVFFGFGPPFAEITRVLLADRLLGFARGLFGSLGFVVERDGTWRGLLRHAGYLPFQVLSRYIFACGTGIVRLRRVSLFTVLGFCHASIARLASRREAEAEAEAETCMDMVLGVSLLELFCLDGFCFF